jgi:hypothetical protein
MTRSDGRWVYPAEGEDPREIDREATDAETVQAKQSGRQVTHDQEPERAQGLSSDRPGVDVSERESVEGVRTDSTSATDPDATGDAPAAE